MPPIRLHAYRCGHVEVRRKTGRAPQDLVPFDGPLDPVTRPRCDDY